VVLAAASPLLASCLSGPDLLDHELEIIITGSSPQQLTWLGKKSSRTEYKKICWSAPYIFWSEVYIYSPSP
jgi:hypothetical protein